MNEERYITFPVTSNNIALVNLLHTLIDKMIVRHFPPNFFKGGVNIDTKTGFRDLYKNNQSKNLNNSINNEDGAINQNVSKINLPRIITTFDFNSFETKETGIGAAAYSQYVNTNVLRKDLRGYYTFFNDYDNNIKLLTTDLRIKVNFNITFDLDTRNDQMSLLTYLYNIIKFNAPVWYNDIPVDFILPNNLMLGLFRILYGQLPMNENIELFSQYLEKYSNKIINTKYVSGDKNSIFFTMNRVYKNVYTQMNGEPEISEPESKDLVFSKFGVTCNGFTEFYIPISYIFTSPDIVRNVPISDFLFISENPTMDNTFRIRHIPSIPKSTFSKNKPYVPLSYIKILEEDFFVDSPIVELDFIDAFPEEMQKIIKSIPKNEYNSIFKILFYENLYPLDDDYVEYINNDDTYFYFKIKDCDVNSKYSILIFADEIELKKYIKK